MSARSGRHLIRNGLVVTASDQFVCDLLIEDEKIACIGMDLPVDGAEVTDATGLYVLPGGIDPHTHVQTADDYSGTCDGFTTGTVSAAFGGTTTIIDFCFQQRGEPFNSALGRWHRKLAAAPPVIDVGFHLAVTDLEAGGGAAALASVVDDGVTSVKVFMAYDDLRLDDRELFQVMRCAAEHGALVMVHAENGAVIDVLVADALADGNIEPRHHVLSRPAAAETEAARRAIELANLADCPLYVVHVSCAATAAEIGRSVEEGYRVWGETCPHYLLVDQDRATDPTLAWDDAVPFVYSPPPRPHSEQEPLWDALASGILSVVSTDHNPFRRSQKSSAATFAAMLNGAPGVETRLQLLHEFGVRAGRISMSRLVELTSTSPAKLFGLYPRKGVIAPGAEADLVLFDPHARVTIRATEQHTNADYSLYEGTEVIGAPRSVFVRGNVIVDRGRLVGTPGVGRFLRRATFELKPGEQRA